MKKIDNFAGSLSVLKNAQFGKAAEDEIYRSGIIWQFGLTFELAWKALQEIMRLHGVTEAVTGSPREILQLGYKHGFISDPAVWLSMLTKRNNAVHIYNEEDADDLVLLIQNSYLPAFTVLEKTLREKLQAVQD